eukprot:jgi/Tetstr1/456164/TSEL_042932.t1
MSMALQPPATIGDTSRQRTVAQHLTVTSERDVLTDTVASLTVEAAKLRDVGERHRAVEKELRPRLAAAEAIAKHQEKARDAANKLYHTIFNFLKRKNNDEDGEMGEEEAETVDERSMASAMATSHGALGGTALPAYAITRVRMY